MSDRFAEADRWQEEQCRRGASARAADELRDLRDRVAELEARTADLEGSRAQRAYATPSFMHDLSIADDQGE